MRKVLNFIDACPLVVTADRWDSEVYINIVQSCGSMRFQHSMTPAQARQLAAYLVECADLLEPRQMPEGVPV